MGGAPLWPFCLQRSSGWLAGKVCDPMKLVTHSGRFHQDEVTATAILVRIYPHAEVVRTRDPVEIETGDIVYDVGRVFDPARRRFDHHQRGFNETFSKKYHIKMSSAGLVFKYFCGEFLQTYSFDTGDSMFDTLVDSIYSDFFLGIDGVDNGYDFEGAYRVRGLSDLVSSFNPPGDSDSSTQNRRFMECMNVVQTDLDNFMDHKLRFWLPKYRLARSSVEACEGKIIVCEEYIPPAMVLDVESEFGKDIKFVVVSKVDEARVYAVPASRKGFGSKVPLREEWRGLEGDELAETSGIRDALFVHAVCPAKRAFLIHPIGLPLQEKPAHLPWNSALRA
ncbi:UNVERIFIED_CONTAM: hypothetical protein PYX00_011896 [Menopon gallinae]|uniref:Metal-dependent protein hydrolase n=1 Tax=Menopon gallinae TaxID=328185 RepID=A0AAW2H8Z6_9NEOP